MAIILAIIQALSLAVHLAPELLAAIKAVIDFIRSLHKTNPAAAHDMVVDLRDAVKAASGGDPKPMQDLAAKVKVHCENGVCTPVKG